MEQPGSADDQRIRKHHTRSRVGCLSCRRRHIRCDGNQPTCVRCTLRDIDCSWAAPDLPLRERRVSYLPGEYKPWLLTETQTALSKVPLQPIKIDPFDTLPIGMPLKSMELLDYFYRIGDYYDISSSARDKEVLRFIIHNATPMRHTLLVAGVHYMWMTGDLEKYSSTILSHKVEAISYLNKELQAIQPVGYIHLVKHVASLSLMESWYGNYGAAEMHVDALITILEHHYSTCGESTDLEFEEEMGYRYFVLTYNYIHHLRSRAKESKALHDMVKGAQTPNLFDYYALIRDLNSQDIGCLKLLLLGASMWPFFFPNLPPTTKFHMTDISTGVNSLRSITRVVQSTKLNTVVENPNWAWVEGSISRSHVAVMNAHVTSLYSHSEGAAIDPLSGQTLTTAWLNYGIATGFYFHSVLRVWNANKPMERRLLRLIMRIYARALHEETHVLSINHSPDLWLWENFVAAYHLATHQLDSHDSALTEIEQYLDAAIYRWSQTFKITNWDQAHKRLMGIAWPSNHPEDVSKMVWTRAVNSGKQRKHSAD